MGNGRSKTSKNREMIPVDSDDGVEINIDIDTELNESLRDRYEEDRLNFHMTAEELDDYLKQHEDVINVVYFDDFYYFSGSENVGELIEDGPREGRILIHDEDLRYSVYSMVDALVKIQKAYSEQTGDNVRLVRNLYVGCEIEDYNNGTRGYTEDVFVITGYSYDSRFKIKIPIEENSSDIVVDSRSDARLKKSQVEDLRNNRLNLGDDKTVNYLIERNQYNNGWFSIAGSHQRSTMTHELGHAVMTRLTSNKNLKGVNSYLKDWFKKYRYDPVSGYSQKNYMEAFAECFNLFIHGGKSNSQMYKQFLTEVAPDLGISNMYGVLR